MIYHFYHCYADGNWMTPVSDHISSMKEYGFENILDGFYIGIVGNKSNRENVISFIKDYNIKFEICAQEDIGWEQVTLKELLDFSKNNNGKVLYGHTKGSYRTGLLQDEWRRHMIKKCIEDWDRCISLLDEYDALGCEIRQVPIPHILGNFWWSHLSIIRKLSPCNNDSRWPPETWLHEFPLNLKLLD